MSFVIRFYLIFYDSGAFGLAPHLNKRGGGGGSRARFGGGRSCWEQVTGHGALINHPISAVPKQSPLHILADSPLSRLPSPKSQRKSGSIA